MTRGSRGDKEWRFPPNRPPNTWKGWEELGDDDVVAVLDYVHNYGGSVSEEFVLHVLQHRENKRSNKIIRRLMWATVGFAAISALFVALSVFRIV